MRQMDNKPTAITRRLWIARSVGAAAALVLGAAAWKLMPSLGRRRASGLLHVVIADPTAQELGCSCVPPSMQKRYQGLRTSMQEALKRPVRFDYIADFLFDELPAGQADMLRSAHLVIGKHSAIAHVVRTHGLPLHHIGTLTREDGSTGLKGVFVVKASSAMRSIGDLNGRSITLGKQFHAEKHAEALAAVQKAHATPSRTVTRLLCRDAVLDVVSGESDAAVISDYSVHLLDNRDVAAAGTLRIIGETAAVLYVAAFARDDLSQSDAKEIIEFLTDAVGRDSGLQSALHTKSGFKPPAGERTGNM